MKTSLTALLQLASVTATSNNLTEAQIGAPIYTPDSVYAVGGQLTHQPA